MPKLIFFLSKTKSRKASISDSEMGSKERRVGGKQNKECDVGEINGERRAHGGRPKNTERLLLPTHPFIDFSMLQLYKASADSSNVALLIREGDPPRPLGVLQLRVRVDASIADAAVEAVHDHGQLHCRRERIHVT